MGFAGLANTVQLGPAEGASGTTLRTAVFAVPGDAAVRDLLPRTLPDLSLAEHIAPATVLSALVIGVVGVGIAALFTVPRLRRIDLSATLRSWNRGERPWLGSRSERMVAV